MPERPGFLTLPPAFFDPSVSNADLQDSWTKGAEEGVRRLTERLATAAREAGQQPTAAKWRDVEALYAQAKEARAFLDEAQANAAHYRQAEGHPTAPAPALPAPRRRLPKPAG